MADNGIQIEGLVFEAGAGAGRDGGSSPVDARSRAVAPTLTEDDLALDRSLRPKRLGDYLGQTKIKESLAILIEAAQARGDVVRKSLSVKQLFLIKILELCTKMA